MIQKLRAFCLFPLLLASSRFELRKEDIQNNRNYYEVIGATTGKKIEDILYAEDRVIETHITAVSAIKKALANEGIDPAIVRFLLYYDGLTISDSQPPRMWQTKSHPDTITSPWLDLTKTVTIYGETQITIRIDATAARLLSDIYSKLENQNNISGFLEIPSIRQSCFRRIRTKYEITYSEIFGGYEKGAAKAVRKNYSCAPEELREPVLSLFQSSKKTSIGTVLSPFYYEVFDELFLHCQDEAEQYYSELYPRLVIRGLNILESESESSLKLEWWNEIFNHIEPINKCQR